MMNRRLLAYSTFALVLTAAAMAEKPVKSAAPVRAGVKTPGVQIPFASLTGEADVALPATPEWIAFSSGSLCGPSGDTIVEVESRQRPHFL